VCAYVAERTGSSLSVQQLARLQAQLQARLGSRNEEQYLAHLRSREGAAELSELMSAIAVHKTDLFRDEVQLRAFEHQVLRPMARAASRPLHLWSAGCATGEEVATLLILLAECGAHARSTVLGTDISEPALLRARELAFHPASLKRVPPGLKERYFRTVGGKAQLVPELRERARFARHNLMDAPYPTSPSGQGFDLIFCRNVLIYFTEAAFDRVVDGLTDRLKPGGCLVLSAAEPLLRPKGQLSLLRCEEAFFYIRTPGPGAPAPVAPPGSGNGLPARPAPAARSPRPPGPAARTEARGLPRQEVDEAPWVEARRIFDLVLEWASAGDEEEQTEQALRKCLYLDPHFSQARYLLAMLLEQRGEKAEAATEYRRALAALKEGRARPTPFFLNEERLRTACESALRRVGFRS
jgi:chemotaxis protein methyltransferase CheR